MAHLNDPNRYALTVWADDELMAESLEALNPSFPDPAVQVGIGKLTEFRDRLQEARFSGVRRVVDSSGESILYDTPESMDRALSQLNAMIRALAAPVRRNPQYIQMRKGL